MSIEFIHEGNAVNAGFLPMIRSAGEKQLANDHSVSSFASTNGDFITFAVSPASLTETQLVSSPTLWQGQQL